MLETNYNEEGDYDSVYYSKEQSSRANIVATRQINKDVMENPYYGDEMNNATQINENETYDYSPNNVNAVTKIENIYYE